MRRYYIAGNWKMNLTPSEGALYAAELAKAVQKGKPDAKVMIAPAFVAIPAVLEAVKGSPIIVAAQNAADHLSGAYTGEVSLSMLKDLGVGTVILGHSERRAIYGESDALINAKTKLALSEGFEVILCVGETLEEREAGKLEDVLSRQVKIGLGGVSSADMSRVVIAYEPVWAIGTGKTATPDDADNAHAYIRGLINGLYGKDVAEQLIIQYGGSVKADNVKELMAKPNVDGALVGGASLSIDKFLPIIEFGL
ncbi:triose-phosphate isomerase [Parasphaerochaeta coccoides]|uniref:Triosephosphate isomerase n=1 Tax=Parasphaerochaeta coccoides (strain ATCC BAA-1237 / DSM 17374 / SPN1) TaxID=760011 RepID=F4GJ61_PARC1|nr:triose-phosphate isomerase [Parasphaerochaeta coccoides]AEC01701.1 triosephosphate isomerase [Parasphaerochaeta coccoides DSM 17374]